MRISTFFVPLFLSTSLPCIFAQGINVAVPGFSQVFNLGKDGDKEIQDRWWFWVIISLIAALFIVLGFFAWRGFRKWKRNKQNIVTTAAEDEEQRVSASKVNKSGTVPPTMPPIRPGIKEDGSTQQRVSVELVDLEANRWKEGKEIKDWVPRYGVDWRAVERRTGSRRIGHHHRRGSSEGGGSRGGMVLLAVRVVAAVVLLPNLLRLYLMMGKKR